MNVLKIPKTPIGNYRPNEKDATLSLTKSSEDLSKDLPGPEPLNPLPELNYSHSAFVDQYLVDYNATRAYQRIYKCSLSSAEASGSRLLNNPAIIEEIQLRINERSERSAIDQDRVVYWLKEIVERCLNSEVIRDKKTGNMLRLRDEEGLSYVKYVFNPMGALKAIDLLGRYLGKPNGPGEVIFPQTRQTFKSITPISSFPPHNQGSKKP